MADAGRVPFPWSPRDRRPVALVTGASAGIGDALARLLARDQHDLVLVARGETRLRALADALTREHGVRVVVEVADLSEASAPARLVARLAAQSIEIDLLVNNAGIGIAGAFGANDVDFDRRMLAVNCAAPTALAKLLLPAMLERRRGSILNVASTAAFQPGPFMAVYYATKAYVLSWSEALREELRGTGVSVTTLCPGPTLTEFQALAGIDDSKLRKLGWGMSAEAVADAAWRGLRRRRAIVIPGLSNKLLAQGTRVMPRAAVVRITRMLQEQALGRATPNSPPTTSAPLPADRRDRSSK